MQAFSAGEQPTGGVRGGSGDTWQFAVGEAVLALAAARQESHHDPLADLDVVDAVAELLDDAGCLMTQQHRDRAWPVPVDDRQIRMADAGRLHTDEHLTGAGGSSSSSQTVIGFDSAYGRGRPISSSTAPVIFIVAVCPYECLIAWVRMRHERRPRCRPPARRGLRAKMPSWARIGRRSPASSGCLSSSFSRLAATSCQCRMVSRSPAPVCVHDRGIWSRETPVSARPPMFSLARRRLDGAWQTGQDGASSDIEAIKASKSCPSVQTKS